MTSQCWYQKTVFTIFLTLSAITSPDIILSNKHPRYLALEFCLICISPYFMWSFFYIFPFKFRSKRHWFCLILTKVYNSLLTTNQSHIFQKSSFNWLSIMLVSLCWQTRHVSWAYRKRWQLTACDMSLTYIKTSLAPE